MGPLVRAIRSDDGGATCTDPVPAAQLEDGLSDMPFSVIDRQTVWGHQWFPWADYRSDGTLVAAWDQDDQAAGGANPVNDTFHHVYWDGSSTEALGSAEHVDVSVTHWAGQYAPESAWPTACGPVGSDTPGKACNAFHGDYTGLQVGPDDSVHITWTGLNRYVTSPQVDPYTGGQVQGYAQDAMYARR